MKQDNRIRIFAAVIAVLMLLPLLFSCGDVKDPAEESGAVTTAKINDDPEETTAPDLFANLDYKNADFVFLAWNQSVKEYDFEEDSGDLIESAIFKRNRRVEDKLKVKFDYVIENGNSSSFTTFCNNASTSINTGTKAWDALACYTRAASLLMINGVLKNLLDVDHLDFSQNCWPQSLVELNTIGDKLYFCSGDIATSLLYQMQFMAVNNDLAEDLNKGNIQDLVFSGEWTVDKVLELAKGVYQGKSDTPRSPENVYGLYVNGHTFLDTFYLGAGFNYVEFDKDGKAVISEDLRCDQSYDLQEKLRKLFWEGDTADGFWSNKGTDITTMMTGGNCLLYVLDGTQLQKYLSESTFSYSILCAPKLNTDQKDYHTAVGFPHSMYCIPYDANNYDMSGAVLELMSEMSYADVSPVIFDTSFKYRYSTGDADGRVFDIVKAGVVFDMGRILFDQLGGDNSGPVRMWRNACASMAANFASSVKSYWKNWTKDLASSIDSIKSHNR